MSQVYKKILKKDYITQLPNTLLTSFLSPKVGIISHNITAEVFDYVMNEPFLTNEFPFLKIDDHKDLLINFASAHVVQLNNRIYQEFKVAGENNSKQAEQLEKLMNGIEFFTIDHYMIKLGEEINDILYIEDFIEHFLPIYKNKYSMIKEEILPYFQDANILSQQSKQKTFYEKIDKTILNYSFEENQNLNAKIALYQIAHRNYLQEISLGDLVKYKIRWGLIEDPKEIE